MIQCEFDLWTMLHNIISIYIYEESTKSGVIYFPPLLNLNDVDVAEGDENKKLNVPHIIDIIKEKEEDNKNNKKQDKKNKDKDKLNEENEQEIDESTKVIGKMDLELCNTRMTNSFKLIFENIINKSHENENTLYQNIQYIQLL